MWIPTMAHMHLCSEIHIFTKGKNRRKRGLEKEVKARLLESGCLCSNAIMCLLLALTKCLSLVIYSVGLVGYCSQRHV